MGFYAFLLFGCAIGYTVAFLVFYFRVQATTGTKDEGKAYPIEYIVTIFNNLMSWGLEFTILLTYIKFSNRMEGQLKK